MAAVATGVLLEHPLARMLVPWYTVASRAWSTGQAWRVESVGLRARGTGLGEEMQLHGQVARSRGDAEAAGLAVAHLQLGRVVVTPLIYWAIVACWPALSWGQRCWRMALGVPVYLALEGVTTAAQLVAPMAQASALLAGESDPMTLWLRWSNFLEAGGQFAVDITAGLATIVLAQVLVTRAARWRSLRTAAITSPSPHRPRSVAAHRSRRRRHSPPS